MFFFTLMFYSRVNVIDYVGLGRPLPWFKRINTWPVHVHRRTVSATTVSVHGRPVKSIKKVLNEGKISKKILA